MRPPGHRNHPGRIHTAEVVGSSLAAPTVFVLVRGLRVADALVIIFRRARYVSRVCDTLSPSCMTSAVGCRALRQCVECVVETLFGTRQLTAVAVEYEADRRVSRSRCHFLRTCPTGQRPRFIAHARQDVPVLLRSPQHLGGQGDDGWTISGVVSIAQRRPPLPGVHGSILNEDEAEIENPSPGRRRGP